MEARNQAPKTNQNEIKYEHSLDKMTKTTDQPVYYWDLLVNISKSLRYGKNQTNLFVNILNKIVENTAVDASMIAIYDRDINKLVINQASGLWQTEINNFLPYIIKGGSPVKFDHFFKINGARENLPPEYLNLFSQVKNIVGYPLIDQDDFLGIFIAGSNQHFNNNAIGFLAIIGEKLINIIRIFALVEDLQRKNDELALAYDLTLEGWSRVLEMRDVETQNHSRRVAGLAVMLAQEMGLKEDEINSINRGALLHDIGKMAIPDNILLKPGKLTEEEWILIRQHPIHAVNMLSSIEYLHPTIDIPHYHHEKWDGTGYPYGLKEKQIPLAARIFAIIDVWDALSSNRPYRSAWAHEDTIDYIRSQSGKHFDPQVVKVFLKMFANFEEGSVSFDQMTVIKKTQPRA